MCQWYVQVLLMISQHPRHSAVAHPVSRVEISSHSINGVALFQSNAQTHFPRTKGLQEQKTFILKMHDRKFVQHNMHTDTQAC